MSLESRLKKLEKHYLKPDSYYRRWELFKEFISLSMEDGEKASEIATELVSMRR